MDKQGLFYFRQIINIKAAVAKQRQLVANGGDLSKINGCKLISFLSVQLI